MKATLFPLALVIIALHAAPAQDIPRPRLVAPPPQHGYTTAASSEDGDLKQNYRITVKFTLGDKSEKEVSLLTASPQVRVNSSVEMHDAATTTIAAEISGMLSEKDGGRLRFSYQISGQISAQTTPQGAQTRNYQLNPESASGTLVAEPGKSYEVFKNGNRAYSITISPEGSAKDAH